MPTAKVRIFLYSTVAAAGLAGLLWTALHKASSNAQVLRDGTILQLGSVSYGKVHRYVSGNVFQQAFGRLLPDPAAKFIEAGVHTISNATDGLVVFLRFPHLSSLRSGPGRTVGTGIEVSDEDGNRFACFERYRSQTAEERVAGFVIPMGRHLSARVRLKASQFDYPNQTNSFEASFDFKNPALRQISRWAPQALPATNEADDFKVTLQSIRPDLLPGPEGARTLLEFSGLDTNQWRVSDIYVVDEAGDSYRPPGASYSASRSSFLGLLSADEAWKIHCEFERVSGFASNEIWVSEPVSLADLPKNDLAFTAMGSAGFGVAGSKLDRDGLELIIDPSPFQTGYYWRLEARDATGSLTKIDLGGGGDHGTKLLYTYSMNLTNAVDPVRFVLSMAKRRFADFIVEPQAGDKGDQPITTK